MDEFIREIYKKSRGNFGQKTTANRRSFHEADRKEKRANLFMKNRNISATMTPLKEDTINAKKSPEKKPPAKNSRLEMLKKWREEKLKRKQEELKKKKPPFKVYGVHKKLNSDIDESMYYIKGKKIPIPEKLTSATSRVDLSKSNMSSTSKLQTKLIRTKNNVSNNSKPSKSARSALFSPSIKGHTNAKTQVSALVTEVQHHPIEQTERNGSIRKIESPQFVRPFHFSPPVAAFTEVEPRLEEDEIVKSRNELAESIREIRRTPRKSIRAPSKFSPCSSGFYEKRSATKCKVATPGKKKNSTIHLDVAGSPILPPTSNGCENEETATLVCEEKNTRSSKKIKVACSDEDIESESSENKKMKPRRSSRKVKAPRSNEDRESTPSENKNSRRSSRKAKSANLDYEEEPTILVHQNKNSKRSSTKSMLVCANDDEKSVPSENERRNSRRSSRKSKSASSELDEESAPLKSEKRKLRRSSKKSKVGDEESAPLESEEKITRRSSRKTCLGDENQKECTPSSRSILNSPKTEIPWILKAFDEKTPRSSKKVGTNEPEEDYDVFKTPENINSKQNNEDVVYISPFVTTSRGKNSARKEFHERRSLNNSNVSSGAKSPKAAAAYFSRILNDEIENIRKKCSVWLQYKEENELSEDSVGLIDMTIGQSNLLISKKFEQFRNLIKKCQDQNDSDMKILCEDLHGFWDMIYKQVTDLEKRFDNLDEMKANDWLEKAPKKKTPKKKPQKKRSAKSVSTASSLLKEAILAARKKKLNSDGDVPIIMTRRSTSLLNKSNQNEVITPGRGILKSDNIKSDKRKTVAFRNLRQSFGGDDGKENQITPKSESKSRKSDRLSSRSKLMFE